MHGGSGISRRQVLISGGLAASAPLLSGTRNAPSLLHRPGKACAPAPAQVHVQFGADAASQAAVSWAAPAAVSRPRLKLGRPGPGFGTEIPAEERVYTEALSGETVFTYHARLDRLPEDTFFVYEVLHDGAPPVAGMFRTAPRRAAGRRASVSPASATSRSPRPLASASARRQPTPATSSTRSMPWIRCST